MHTHTHLTFTFTFTFTWLDACTSTTVHTKAFTEINNRRADGRQRVSQTGCSHSGMCVQHPAKFSSFFWTCLQAWGVGRAPICLHKQSGYQVAALFRSTQYAAILPQARQAGQRTFRTLGSIFSEERGSDGRRLRGERHMF